MTDKKRGGAAQPGDRGWEFPRGEDRRRKKEEEEEKVEEYGITARRSDPGSGRSGRLAGPRVAAAGPDLRRSGRAPESRIPSHLKDRERGGTTKHLNSRGTDGWRETG